MPLTFQEYSFMRALDWKDRQDRQANDYRLFLPALSSISGFRVAWRESDVPASFSEVRPMSTVWPELSYPAWRDTQATLQLWTQIVGKIRLTQTPWLNHGWHVTLYVTS